jgi:hypothetical protein
MPVLSGIGGKLAEHEIREQLALLPSLGLQRFKQSLNPRLTVKYLSGRIH